MLCINIHYLFPSGVTCHLVKLALLIIFFFIYCYWAISLTQWSLTAADTCSNLGPEPCLISIPIRLRVFPLCWGFRPSPHLKLSNSSSILSNKTCVFRRVVVFSRI